MLFIFLRANFPILVQFSKLSACVTCIDNTYDVMVCTDSSKLVYGESKTFKYTCKYIPSPNDVGKEITVNIQQYNVKVIELKDIVFSRSVQFNFN